MGVIFETSYSLPSGDQPLTHARIAHSGNWLINGTAVPSSTAAGYFADGPLNSLTYEKWTPYANYFAEPTDFEAADWVKNGATVSGSLMAEDTSGVLHRIYDSMTLLSGAQVAYFDVKAAGRTEFQILAFDGTTTFSGFFDLTDGTVGTVSNATGAMRHLGGGRYRCSLNFTATAAAGTIQLRLSSGSETTTYTGDGASGVYVYAAWNTQTNMTWEYDHGFAAECDYCCIAAHNMGTNGNTLQVQWYDGATWQNLIASTAVADDMPIMVIFAPITKQRWRIRVTGGIPPEIGVIKFGLAMQMERPFYGGHTPLDLGRQTVLRSNYSETGEYLGRTKIRTSLATSFSWANLTAAWVRTNWRPFQKAIEDEPFFIAWRPGDFSEVGLCQVDASPAPTNQGVRDLMSVEMQVRGYGYD